MYEPASKRGSPANTCPHLLPIPLRKGTFNETLHNSFQPQRV